MIYVVIDTNVLVSALITKNPEAATAKVVRQLLDSRIWLKRLKREIVDAKERGEPVWLTVR